MAPSSKVVALKPARTTKIEPVNGTVPNRKANDALRTRNYLTEDEIDKVLKVAKAGKRNPKRDHLMVLMAFRHGYRVGELVDLQWSDIDFKRRTLHVRRTKGSHDSTHYLESDELRPLKALHKDSESPYVFVSERGSPISAAGFRKQFARWGEKAKIGFPINPHMLRHATGYALANNEMDTRSLQAYLGHASITNTVKYTAMSPTRFKGIWKR